MEAEGAIGVATGSDAGDGRLTRVVSAAKPAQIAICACIHAEDANADPEPGGTGGV
ncbi:MAG: hypothetical protein U9R47_07245 [Actinomycetota bacterium]|nr:hypothetical protein [Actinomycetota bacterium]